MTTKYYKITEEFIGHTAFAEKRIFIHAEGEPYIEIYYKDEYNHIYSPVDMMDIMKPKELNNE